MAKKYRISVHLNRITVPYQEDFEKARQYHVLHDVDIEFIFKQIDVRGYRSIYSEKMERYLIEGAEDMIELDSEADANLFAFDQGEWTASSDSAFPLLPETPNGSCATTNGRKPFITIGTYIVEHENGQTWIQIAHEIMHSYVQNAVLKGLFIQDVMDTYRENSNPLSPTGNFSEQWELLQPYILLEDKSEDVVLSPNLPYTIDMAKRDTTLGPKKKSRHSRKTKKRLAIKKVMLTAKAAKKRK
jgi:hypothetical protein